MTLRLVHVSDLHLPSDVRFRWSYLLDKRVTGFVNLVVRRWRLHSLVLAHQLARAIRELRPDHVVVTGDLTNLALPEEFDAARRWLDALALGPERITVVAGNHDAYTRRAWRDGYMRKALGPYCGEARPVVRLLGEGVVLVAAESARPRPPFLAQGKLGREQLLRIERVLAAHQGRARILALHHPVLDGLTRWQNVLLDVGQLRDILGRVGAETVVCGHLHKPYGLSVPGPAGRQIPVFGVGSGSMDAATPRLRAQFRLLEVDGSGLRGEELYVHDPDRDAFVPWMDQDSSGPSSS